MKLTILTLPFAAALVTTAPAQDMAARPSPPKIARPKADEPKAATFSMRQAAEQLGTSSVQWTREHKCGSCHSNYPYMISGPLLRDFGSTGLREVRAFFEKRVEGWDNAKPGSKPKWDAKVISTAQALAACDALTAGSLHPLTRRALDRVWTLQKADGGFDWIKCGWPPLEHDDYYGAIVAALGAGYAPEGYAKGLSARTGLDRIRGYFQKNPPPDLHHQTMLLWASTRLEGLMTSARQQETIRELRGRQKSDGGWCLPSLGHWNRRNGKPNDPAAPSDGYATGLVVFVLREAGVPASDPAIERGVAWLKANQARRAAGSPARSTMMKTITSPTPAPATPCWRFSVARPKRRQWPGLS